MNVILKPLHMEPKVSRFLQAALEPIRTFLDNPAIVEICANGPGTVWVEVMGEASMQRHDVKGLGVSELAHLAERVAALTNQAVNERHPLLSASLEGGERFQGVLPPATPNGGAFAIRKQVIKNMSLDDYRAMGSFDRVTQVSGEALSEADCALCEALDQDRIEDFIRLAVKHHYSMLLSGGTSSGKTTFLNAVLKEVPLD
ncbi:MAG: Flp pilus assembly complex ATPase component TadA, partial [Hyphomicrobiales bacterium]|nr:Flp pilus assembly complex ATPase component TadA [Hyphomicrobiales bacterium]